MKPRILLVEDDPTSRAFLLAATESLPADVDTAGSVAEALALATRHAHALWLIDAQLPDGRGETLLQRLRALGLSTPAIAHTATHERAGHDALLACGFTATVAKPLPAADWLGAIRQVLEGCRHGAAADNDAAAPDPEPVWDEAQALAALAGNAANVTALRGLFLAELPATRDAVATAAALGDAEAVRAQLHRLRAGCGFVGAARLQEAAARLHASPASTAVLRRFLDAAQATLSIR